MEGGSTREQQYTNERNGKMWSLIAEWRGRSLKKEREGKTTLRMFGKKRNCLPKITHNTSKSMCISMHIHA